MPPRLPLSARPATVVASNHSNAMTALFQKAVGLARPTKYADPGDRGCG
jgi:hypothetical protein